MSCQRHITYYLQKIGFVLEKFADQILQDEINLTHSQFRVLMAIEHKTVCQRDIAEYWNMTDAAVSRQIESLINSKLIHKKENPENRRQHALVLTAKGKAKLEKGMQLIDKKYQEMYQTVPKKDQKIVEDSLKKMLDCVCPAAQQKDCV